MCPTLTDGHVNQDVFVLDWQLALNPRSNRILCILNDPESVVQGSNPLSDPAICPGQAWSTSGSTALDADVISNVLARGVVLPPFVDDAPSALLIEVVGAGCLVNDGRVLGEERIAGEVVFRPDGSFDWEDSTTVFLCKAVDHRVDTDTEHMLMTVH
ncbi:hypothetical protein BDZ97DRAFT_1921150 [Flammula alnicola]|nr:hypothetical protein BDZ97DRAFT_1921150 [Flammula alnicola]